MAKGWKDVLPVVSEQAREQLMAAMADDAAAWKKWMIHHLKDDNPEINTLLLELAKDSPDPKGLVMAGYAVYRALELAQEVETATLAPLDAMLAEAPTEG